MKDYSKEKIERNARKVQYWLEKNASECEVCNHEDVQVLTFYPSMQYFLNRSYSFKRLEEEIMKRQIVCRNCLYLLEHCLSPSLPSTRNRTLKTTNETYPDYIEYPNSDGDPSSY